MNTKVKLLEAPCRYDWMEVKRRAFVTIGKGVKQEPTDEWKRKILKARHSPIRYLRFAFFIENLPYWVSVHLCRHVHAQPYVETQRNDRQTEYDRENAPQNAPVSMIWDMNAEELMTIANKRLCNKASEETREIVGEMCAQVIEACPEFDGLLVPACQYNNICHEMNSCGKNFNKKPLQI